MRIKSVTPRLLRNTPDPANSRTYSMGGVHDWHILLVEIETDDGVTGWGEAYDGGPGQTRGVRAIIEHAFTPALIGADPLDTEVLWDRLFAMHRNHGFQGAHVEALSAVDIALWDLKGKLLGQPVAKLLGGRFRDRIRVYATGVYWHEGADDPTRAAVDDLHALIRRGFRAVKMGGGYGVRDDLERATALREAAGPDFWLAMDANCAYTLVDAKRVARGLEPLDFAWFEEPLPPEDVGGYVALRESTTVPIAGAELVYTRYGFRDVLAKGMMDILQPDMTAVGGYTEYRRILALASAYNTAVTPHGWVSAVGQFANLQLAATIPPMPLRWRGPEFILEMGAFENPLRDELSEEPIPREGDMVTVPDRPGIGVTVRRDQLAKYEVN